MQNHKQHALACMPETFLKSPEWHENFEEQLKNDFNSIF